MADKDQSDQEFKVEDRRRFSSGTGERREEKTFQKEPDSPKAEASAEKESSTSLPEMTFAGFVLGLSAQAMMFLGEVPDPQGGQVGEDLSAARQFIDILGILKDKTAGNLEKDEEQLLERALYDLRTKYIELVKKK